MFYQTGFKQGFQGATDGARIVILTVVIGTIVSLFC